MRLLFKYIFSVLLLLSGRCFAQTFITKVSATSIGKKDILEIEYVAENVQMDQFVLPGFKDWTVVSGPNLSTSRMQNGNVVKQETIYSVMVQPAQTGTLTIPGATALINNKPQRSNPVAVLVKDVPHVAGNNPPAQQAPAASLFDQFPFEDALPSDQYLKKGEKATDKIRNNILVRVEVNKRSCYAGEPILATYKLCTRLRSKSKVVKQPGFNGCTVIELTGDDQDQHVEKINGSEYNVFVIRKVQLVPLEAGSLILPETSVENKVSFYDARQMNYRDSYYNAPATPAEEQTVTLQNKPVTVEVKALPPLPSVGGTDFSGAVGNFDVSIATGDEALTSNTTHHLSVTIQGEGNLQQVKAPVIKWPKGVEGFDAAEQDEDDKSGFPVKRRKTFSFPFVADKKGRYTVPTVEFTYFDANANKYVTKATRPLVLSVTQGKRNFLASLTKASDEEGFQDRLYVLLGAAFLAIIIGLIWYNGKLKPKQQPVAQAAPASEQKPEVPEPDSGEFLFNIRELQPGLDSSYFYKLLCRNLLSYLQARFRIEPAQLPGYAATHPEQEGALQQLKLLLDDCNVGMYTPVFTIEEAMQHRLKAIELLSEFEKDKYHAMQG